ncbi:MAG: SMI1/KNR4 family protein [Spirochaetales bacterium]|nr:SMI1/KNR4 family protein [Spirochaetales bacterium]
MKILSLIKKLVADGIIEKNEPISMSEITEIEKKLCVIFPDDIKEVYTYSNGFDAFDGNLQLYPMAIDDDFCILNASNSHRSWDWPIPQEMVIFGDNGCGEPYGFWLSEGKTETKCLIVQTGEIFEDKCLSIVANSFSDFLLIVLSFNLLDESKDNFTELTEYYEFDESIVVDDEELLFKNIKNVINPNLMNFTADPYRDLLNKKEVIEFAKP